MNFFFFHSRNFRNFVRNKKNISHISNLTINRLKSRCLDKIEKRTYISLQDSSKSLITCAQSITFLSNSDLASILSSNNTLSVLDNNLDFIMNEDLILDKW